MTTARETGSRADFLATVRRAVTTPHRHETRAVDPLPSPLPDVEYQSSVEPQARIDAFADALGALGGVARRVDDLFSLIATLGDALALAKPDDPRPTRVVLTDEPECAGIATFLAHRDDIDVVPYDSAPTVATADLGITGARAGVALTGSIVVDAGRAGGRTVSLLPPVHLALVRSDAIVTTPGESWRALGSPMPSNLVQITGPSRSADIELVITLGVHGPRALLVGVLVEFPEAREVDTPE